MTVYCCSDCESADTVSFRNDWVGDLDELELGVGAAVDLVAENIDGAPLWRELAIRGRFPNGR